MFSILQNSLLSPHEQIMFLSHHHSYNDILQSLHHSQSRYTQGFTTHPSYESDTILQALTKSIAILNSQQELAENNNFEDILIQIEAYETEEK